VSLAAKGKGGLWFQYRKETPAFQRKGKNRERDGALTPAGSEKKSATSHLAVKTSATTSQPQGGTTCTECGGKRGKGRDVALQAQHPHQTPHKKDSRPSPSNGLRSALRARRQGKVNKDSSLKRVIGHRGRREKKSPLPHAGGKTALGRQGRRGKKKRSDEFPSAEKVPEAPKRGGNAIHPLSRRRNDNESNDVPQGKRKKTNPEQNVRGFVPG